MFRKTSDEEFERSASAGTRPLFTVGSFVFQDTMDAEGTLHHFIVEHGEDEEDPVPYETDRSTMYELVARYLAGEYEKEAYELEQSPGHHALLDLLELAAARSRSGDTNFSLTELDGIAEELIDEDELEDEE
jgi:hypothetical protein